jgi:carbonic anhydrase/acetyltransferase-like protein (isoleucine patch superfamily)
MIYPYRDYEVELAEGVFVAPSADLIGRLKVGSDSSIWFQTLIRADVHFITIGARTNVQDQSCLHVTGEEASLSIGDEVTIGHQVVLHGCHIGNRVLVGMGSLIMDHARIEDECIVGAGSLITENKVFPSGHLILGRPAKIIRELTPEEKLGLKRSAISYVETAKNYLERGIGKVEKNNYFRTKDSIR